MSALLDELKNSRPIPPLPITINQPNDDDDDDRFSCYLASLMRNIPKRHKIILQGKIIAMVINEMDN